LRGEDEKVYHAAGLKSNRTCRMTCQHTCPAGKIIR
jgi:hypothetical protein